MKRVFRLLGTVVSLPNGSKGLYPKISNAWIENHDGRLRIRCRHSGKTRTISLGIEDGKPQRGYSSSYPYVFALFHTAARPGELAALTWNDVTDDFSSIKVRASFSRGTRRNQTKTGRSHPVFCNLAFQELLRSLHAERKPKKSDLLFATPKGHPIDDHRFRRRAWTKVLESLGVPYRGLYCCRHNSISLAALSGANLIELSEQTGHSKRTMMQTYLHAVEKSTIFGVLENGTIC